MTVQTGGGGNFFAVRGVVHAEDAALHRRKPADERGVIADFSVRLPEDAIDLRHSIRTAHQNFVTGWMPRHRLQSATQRTRGDGRDIVHKPLRGRLR